MATWLAIDHGTRRVGVAAGDTETRVATPVTVLPAEPAANAIAGILELAGEYDAVGLVVGWPVNMDGTEGPQGRLARDLAARLEAACPLDVRLWDERLSSFAADDALAGQLTRKKRRAIQDAVAAGVFLQDFLNRNGPDEAPRPSSIPSSGNAPPPLEGGTKGG